jgi:hypothetical protein
MSACVDVYRQLPKMPSIDDSALGTTSCRMKIPPPKVNEKHPDRFLQCQEAIHVAFQELVDSAADVGWRPDEVLISLIELADNQALVLGANAEVDAALAILKRKFR